VSDDGTLYAEWTRVADCEEGGWIGYAGYNYPDSLGITRANWYAGAAALGVSPSDLDPYNQIAIDMWVTGGWIPDQNGCSSY
jgi:hypothetical protein